MFWMCKGRDGKQGALVKNIRELRDGKNRGGRHGRKNEGSEFEIFHNQEMGSTHVLELCYAVHKYFAVRFNDFNLFKHNKVLKI